MQFSQYKGDNILRKIYLLIFTIINPKHRNYSMKKFQTSKLRPRRAPIMTQKLRSTRYLVLFRVIYEKKRETSNNNIDQPNANADLIILN